MRITERWKGSRELPSDIQQKLKGLPGLFEREGVSLAYLFGSVAQSRSAQDVDLAILVEDSPAFRLREAIVECLGTERIDLVDLRRASPVLRFEIIRTAQPLWTVDEETLERFELATLHVYRDTHPLRHQQRDYLRRRMGQWSSDGDLIEGRLKELDQVLTELSRYRNVAREQFRADLSQRWIIERGLIAAASIIFDVADHILAGHYGLYP